MMIGAKGEWRKRKRPLFSMCAFEPLVRNIFHTTVEMNPLWYRQMVCKTTQIGREILRHLKLFLNG